MTNNSIRKFSLLSLVLVGASAVAAAILPSASRSDPKNVYNGKLFVSTGYNEQNLTCAAAVFALNCDRTLTVNNGYGSSTSVAGSDSDTFERGNATYSDTTT